MEKESNKNSRILNSSTSLDNQDEDIEVYIPEESPTHLSVTTVLNYCKLKILNPYLRLLSLIGFRSLINEQQELCFCLRFLSYSYTIQAVGFMIIGYILQYMSCFRRDRGFWFVPKNEELLTKNDVSELYHQTCDGSALFSFIIPSTLHLIGYLYAVHIFRSADDEQLPILMERVFLLSTNLSNSFATQKKLVKMLWIFVLISIMWMTLSLILVSYMMAEGEINFKWMSGNPPWVIMTMKVLLIICTLLHDMVQATIISNYCLQAQLLTYYAFFMREKLLQHPVQPIEWLREIEDFKKLLNYLNNKIAPSVCLLTIVNISYVCSGLLWIGDFDHIDKNSIPTLGLSFLNVVVWLAISISPFIQAARLSHACEVLKMVGQEARTRPYVHLDTPTIELDSILLYTTSLSISGKLFLTPITGRKLCFWFTVAFVIIVILGQCHFLSAKMKPK